MRECVFVCVCIKIQLDEDDIMLVASSEKPLLAFDPPVLTSSLISYLFRFGNHDFKHIR